jgi:nucleolar protein 14
VFEVPTTLEALHGMIGNYASTGQDASLIIHRIHKANSVRLNRNNMEKMQNFYDVLLRRFVAVGDAIHSSGDGGPTLGRYKQLDELTKTLYAMSQDSPECAGSVWGRRLGILQNAHAKRLRDAEFAVDGDDFSAWPSTGTILLLRALGHAFPVTDMRHTVVTPALLLLGQMVAQTPVRSMNDAVTGIMCAGLMIEFTKDAKRIAPEALSFLAGILRLFAVKPGRFPIPSLEASAELPAFASLRKRISVMLEMEEIPRLSLHKDDIQADTAPFAVLCSALHLIEAEAVALCGSLNDAEAETFAEITDSLLALRSKKYPLPELVAQKVLQAASAVSSSNKTRVPLLRRMGPSVTESAIKTLAPRMEDPTRYSLSKDKGKPSVQAAIDRTRREYKREHKAVARELRLDAAFIESERRKEKGEKDAKAREKRNKNFSWMEGEQAAMNQQVRQGGGLLSGGGTGAARAKARSGKVGIKKGGKFKS